MNKSIFNAAPFFFLRAPLWSAQDCDRIFAQENWKEELFHLYKTNQLLREAIAIASPSLYRSLEQKPLKDPEQAAISLLNYVGRMTTRATPFGLFSFVTTGSWSEETKATFDLHQVYKCARPDMEWVFSVVQKYYQDEALFPSLPIQSNPLIRIHKERCYLTYVRNFEKGEKEAPKSISIRVTPLVEQILELSQESIGIDTLWSRLHKRIPSLAEDKTKQVIRTLLHQQVLLPSLLPSLLSNSPFETLLHSVPELQPIAKSIQAYNHCFLGQGESDLLKLQKEMGALAQTKTFIQVDAGYQTESTYLSKKVVEEIEKSIDILWKISASVPPPSVLTDYLKKFVEKYGTHRTVPLLELLSAEKGLGPFENSSSPTSSTTPFSQQWEKWLSQEWQKCISEKRDEIIVTEKLIDDLFVQAKEKPPHPEEAPLSLDVFCKVFADTPQQIDEGNFLLLLSQLNWVGGSTLGRFLPVLGEELQTDLSRHFRREEELDSDALFVELSYWPSKVRYANVAIQPCLRKYRLDIEEKKRDPASLSLKDIYVGATSNRFYLTLKSGGVEVVPCIGNLLTSKLAPTPFQFMREVNLTRHKLIYPFSWGKTAKNGIFFPRVRFEKTILSPAQWNLDPPLLPNATLKELSSFFVSWADRWALPPRFFLVRADLHLLLDRRHPAHLNEIALKLKKGESLQFIEEANSAWIKSERGTHFSEIVATFLKNPSYSKQKKSFAPSPYLDIPFEKRWKLPGSEWLFAKLYGSEEEIETFLVRNLALFAEHLNQEIGLLGWFFIRYNDPEKHIRFRLHLRSPEQLSKALDLFKEACSSWMEGGLIKNVVLSSYEREVERYGGAHLIEAAEAVFCADTEATLYLLRAVLEKRLSLHPAVFRALSVIYFLKDFGLSEEELLLLLDRPGSRSKLEGFREHKKALLSLPVPEAIIFDQASQLRRPAIKTFYSSAQDLSIDHRNEVIQSILHLHCNRLGCNTNEELSAYLYAHQTLLQMKYLKNSGDDVGMKIAKSGLS